MNITRFLGIAILIIGVVLLVFGVLASNAFTEKAMVGVVGHYTEHTMWYLIGGVAMVISGWFLTFSGRCCNR